MNIQTDAIQVSFGSKTILHDISLAIQDKEFVGIIGPKRMDYKKVVKTLKNLTEELDDIFKDKS